MANRWSDDNKTLPTPTIYAPTTPIASPAPPPMVDRDSMARERMRRRRVRSRRRGADWAWVVIAGAMLSVVIIVSMSMTFILRASQDGVAVLPTAAANLPTPVNARQDLAALANIGAGDLVTLDDGRSIVLAPWDGSSRYTLLVMGLDRRPNERGLAYRTDTMMLVSIDPTTQSVGILSIPRDLYVDVPGYGELQRVNSAMVLGELQQPGYGPQLTMQTVQYNLGIRVYDYVLMDFNAVISLIDVLGGVDIVLERDLIDYQYPDMNFGYDPLILRAGPQHLDGATALKFARTRHGDNDFERARRQQQLMYALRDRVLSANMLPQLIVQSPSILSALNNNLYTSLTVDRIIQLGLYLRDIPTDNIRTGVIDGDYLAGYVTQSGAQVLVPRRSILSNLLTEVFGQNYSE